MQVWEVSSGSLISSIEHGGWVCRLDISNCGTMVATGSSETKIRLWGTLPDSLKDEPIKTMQDMTDMVWGYWEK